MSVYQVNLWVCDRCGATGSTSERTDVWSDPVVQPPQGWSTDHEKPTELRKWPGEDVWDLCPKCTAETVPAASADAEYAVVDRNGEPCYPTAAETVSECMRDLRRVLTEWKDTVGPPDDVAESIARLIEAKAMGNKK